MIHFQSLTDLFEQNERQFTDLMEPYSTRLGGTLDAAERVAIMRAGLRETICRRYPLPAVKVVAAVDDRQGVLSV